MTTLTVYTPSGLLVNGQGLKRAVRRLSDAGFEVSVDPSTLAKQQRFGGDDETRLAAIHRVAAARPDIAMASRGGYGLTRLVDRIDWTLIRRSVDAGTRWVGYSDLTALQMGLLAHTGSPSWWGPHACDDFGRETLDEVTPDCFVEAMSGALEAVGFRTDEGHDGLDVTGTLWGGNLAMLCSLLGTPHWPRVKGGVLLLEDVAEHPYRVERMLLQLCQSGVLARQKALVLGAFSEWRKSPLDRGYDFKAMVRHVRSVAEVPVLTGFPFGHVATKVTVPLGVPVQLAVQGREAYLGWAHAGEAHAGNTSARHDHDHEPHHGPHEPRFPRG